MDDDIRDELDETPEEDLELKKKDPLDEAESADDLAEEELDETEPFDDVDLT